MCAQDISFEYEKQVLKISKAKTTLFIVKNMVDQEVLNFKNTLIILIP